METVGFVGTGAMGTALLSRLQRVPIAATAFDVVPQALEQAKALGAEPVASAKAVAQRSTLIDVVVRTDQQVLDCTLVMRESWKEPHQARWCCCTARFVLPRQSKSPTLQRINESM